MIDQSLFCSRLARSCRFLGSSDQNVYETDSLPLCTHCQLKMFGLKKPISYKLAIAYNHQPIEPSSTQSLHQHRVLFNRSPPKQHTACLSYSLFSQDISLLTVCQSLNVTHRCGCTSRWAVISVVMLISQMPILSLSPVIIVAKNGSRFTLYSFFCFNSINSRRLLRKHCRSCPLTTE